MPELRAAVSIIRAFSSVETIFADVSPMKNRAAAAALKPPAVVRRAQSEVSVTLASRPI